MGTYVGEIQERWRFPSDHLPIAITFDDINIASWNVLDANYMEWIIEKNSQGLSRSLIADEHIYLKGSNLTMRECHVIQSILEMIHHPTHPRSLISLQECNKPFINALRKKLPHHMNIISNHGECLLVNTDLFLIEKTKRVTGIFTDTPKRPFQEVILQRIDTGTRIKLINVHLPGDPQHLARFEFCRYLSDTLDPSMITIAMGDMNFNELEMDEALAKSTSYGTSPFSIHSPYCTNISPQTFQSKAIDHFMIYLPTTTFIELNIPEQIMSGLDEMVSLLQ